MCEAGEAQRVRGIDRLEHVESDGLVLDLLGGVPREQLLHRGIQDVEDAVLERTIREDRGEVLGGGGAGEVELGRHVVLDPPRDLRVTIEEPIDLEALRAQDGIEIVVRARVMALLLEECFDLGLQGRVGDLVEVVMDRSHEEPLAVWK